MHGIGKLNFHGAEFMGDFKNDVIDGIGILKFLDGHVYTGMFANGDRCKYSSSISFFGSFPFLDSHCGQVELEK